MRLLTVDLIRNFFWYGAACPRCYHRFYWAIKLTRFFIGDIRMARLEWAMHKTDCVNERVKNTLEVI